MRTPGLGRRSTPATAMRATIDGVRCRWLPLIVVLAGVLTAWLFAGRAEDDLMRAWSGLWSPPGAHPGGSVDLILIPGTQPGRATGQFTFIRGANSQTTRYEGTVVDGVVRFALPAEGEIVLRQDASRLVGEFSGGQTWLPVATGTLELTRPR